MDSNSAVIVKSSDSAELSSPILADRTLDITRDICPMTFVRTRLALDCLAAGQTLLVLLRGEEPRRNVPASARSLGHAVLMERAAGDGITQVLLRKA